MAPENCDRRRLRYLDACLGRLEEAHLRGEQRVSASLAARIEPHVPAIRAGILIIDAIDLVLRDQEPHLTGQTVEGADPADRGPGALSMEARAAVVVVPDDDGAPPLAEGAARDLTDRIKIAVIRFCSLLLEAHERRAWVALGYPSWESYIRTEFHLSRSRSYEILDHGRVLRALEAATGVSGIPDISPYAAAQIKPYLVEVTESIRARTSGAPPSTVAQVARQVVSEVRARLSARAGSTEASSVVSLRRPIPAPPTEIAVYDALYTLAHIPSVEDTLAPLTTEQRSRIAPLLARALQRLTELVDICESAHGEQERSVPSAPREALCS
jgi:hypothetical protein